MLSHRTKNTEGARQKHSRHCHAVIRRLDLPLPRVGRPLGSRNLTLQDAHDGFDSSWLGGRPRPLALKHLLDLRVGHLLEPAFDVTQEAHPEKSAQSAQLSSVRSRGLRWRWRLREGPELI